jgi:uncharacterized delta-60 repeat protein
VRLRSARNRSAPFARPLVETLEDRCLLSAGALDTTFGGTGVVTTSLSKGGDGADAVLVQPWDGKIVAAGSAHPGSGTVMGLARYNTDGTLDSTFGSGGIVVSKVGTNGSNVAALYPSTDTTGNAKKIVEAGGGTVARFNANGGLDTSFGSRGTVSVSYTITGVVIQPDGKIVVDGYTGSVTEVSRFKTNGTLDTAFGSGGTATLSGPFVDYQCLLLQPDGKLVVGGESGGGPNEQLELARLTANGVLDPTFNSAGPTPGIVTAALANPAVVDLRLALYPSTGTDAADYGKIVAAGTILGNPGGINSNQITLARYNPDGTADATFGQSGQVVTPFPSGGGRAWAAAIQADGKVVVAGDTYQYPGNGHWTFSLLRYNTDGSQDATFGSGGIVTTPNGTGDGQARAVALQVDGRIVTAGKVQAAAGSGDWNFMTARYLAGPEIGTFTSSAATVTAGSSLTLSASNLSDGDPGATITQVAFYAVDQSGNQYLLGTGTLSNGVWTLSYTVNIASGSYTLFAQATDSDGTIGDSAFLTLIVQ